MLAGIKLWKPRLQHVARPTRISHRSFGCSFITQAPIQPQPSKTGSLNNKPTLQPLKAIKANDGDNKVRSAEQDPVMTKSSDQESFADLEKLRHTGKPDDTALFNSKVCLKLIKAQEALNEKGTWKLHGEEQKSADKQIVQAEFAGTTVEEIIYKSFPQAELVENRHAADDPGSSEKPMVMVPKRGFDKRIIGCFLRTKDTRYYIELGTQVKRYYPDHFLYDLTATTKLVKHDLYPDQVQLTESAARYQNEPGKNGAADSIAGQKDSYFANPASKDDLPFYGIYHSLAASSIAGDAAAFHKHNKRGIEMVIYAMCPMACCSESTMLQPFMKNVINMWRANDVVPTTISLSTLLMNAINSTVLTIRETEAYFKPGPQYKRSEAQPIGTYKICRPGPTDMIGKALPTNPIAAHFLTNNLPIENAPSKKYPSLDITKSPNLWKLLSPFE